MHEWRLRDRVLTIGERPLVMGIVNITPDSFSDGGRYASCETAVAHALELVREGADVLDLGGESTRPGSQPVALDEELGRVTPVVESLVRQVSVPLSIDTSKAEVARQCLALGAHIVNDVTALAGDPAMAALVRQHDAGLVLMHMQGAPATMQASPRYDDAIADIGNFFEERLKFAATAAIAASRIVIDPGIGFGKTVAHNLQILTRLAEFQRLGRPLCLGVSRKGFIGRLLNRPVEQRLAGSLAAACWAASQGAAQIVRVHDVAATRDAVELIAEIRQVAQGRGTGH